MDYLWIALYHKIKLKKIKVRENFNTAYEIIFSLHYLNYQSII